MTALVTFASALAACTERFGESDDVTLYDGCPVASWPWVPDDDERAHGGISLTELGELVLCAGRGGAWAYWLLAADDLTLPGAPLTPLPDALDEAAAWLRAHDGGTR